MAAASLGVLLGPRVFRGSWLLHSAVPFAFGLLHVAAIFLLTAQEPRITLTESGLTWRRIVRAAAVTGLLSGWASTFARAVGTPLGTALITGVMVIEGIAGPIKTFGEFAYAGALAARIPDAVLVRRTRTVKWGLSITGFLLSISVMTLLPLGWSPARGAMGGPPVGVGSAVSTGGGGAGSGGTFSLPRGGPA